MSWGNAILLDPANGIAMVNETDIDADDIMEAFTDQHSELAAEMGVMSRWIRDVHRPRRTGIFERDTYATPSNIFDQMRVAQHAAEEDNVVSGVIETTEALAFTRMSVESYDLDETDIWNQIIDDLDLDARLREMWSELFTVSQVYIATWWGNKTYRVSGRDPQTGVKRKKVFANLRVPVGLTLLDPLKILPVGNTMFNQDQLCYIATREEGEVIADYIKSNRTDDQIISNLMTGEYVPQDRQEQMRIAALGFSNNRLFTLDPQYVWRHTATRPQYKRFADIRLKSIFPLLDLKNQLREMDRAWLIGGTNFIVLVKRGDKDSPARPEEVAMLQSQVRTMARVPLIVSDHRLTIEIITPKVEHTLQPEKHDLIDHRIFARLLQTFSPTGSVGRSDDSVKFTRMVALGMESRRNMLRKAFEKQVLKATFDKNDLFKEIPKLVFYPHRIALYFDPDLAAYYLDLRDRGDLSRDTMLAQIDVDQIDEYYKRKMEKDLGFDDVFQTQVPFTEAKPQGIKPDAAGPSKKPVNPSTTRTAGRNLGGNRNGGGRAPGTGQGVKKENATEEEDEGADE